MTVQPLYHPEWGLTFRKNEQAKLRLFCFAYAGGGASIFSRWHEKLPREIEVVAVQLPGRENRFKEPLETRWEKVIDGILGLIEARSKLPYLFFGHSLGALLAFEVTRMLRRRQTSLPLHLMVSGKRAPAMPSRIPPIYNLPDEELVEAMISYNGTDKSILENEELLCLVLKRMRADATLFDLYEYRSEEPLDCAVTSFGGDNDPFVNAAEVRGWETETTSTFEDRMLPGDHFFIHSAEDRLLSHVTEIVNRYTGSDLASTRMALT